MMGQEDVLNRYMEALDRQNGASMLALEELKKVCHNLKNKPLPTLMVLQELKRFIIMMEEKAEREQQAEAARGVRYH